MHINDEIIRMQRTIILVLMSLLLLLVGVGNYLDSYKLKTTLYAGQMMHVVNNTFDYLTYIQEYEEGNITPEYASERIDITTKRIRYSIELMELKPFKEEQMKYVKDILTIMEKSVAVVKADDKEHLQLLKEEYEAKRKAFGGE